MSDEEKPSSFRDAVGDVKPLSPKKVVASTKGRPTAPKTSAEVDFEILEDGEQRSGLAKGIDRRQLKRLRRGEFPVEMGLDLHGQLEQEAEQATREFIIDAYEEGLRCVLIIHGRGLHSESEPVLKQGFLHWVQQAGVAEKVLAFTTAPPELGGSGASLVLLRRQR